MYYVEVINQCLGIILVAWLTYVWAQDIKDENNDNIKPMLDKSLVRIKNERTKNNRNR